MVRRALSKHYPKIANKASISGINAYVTLFMVAHCARVFLHTRPADEQREKEPIEMEVLSLTSIPSLLITSKNAYSALAIPNG